MPRRAHGEGWEEPGCLPRRCFQDFNGVENKVILSITVFLFLYIYIYKKPVILIAICQFHTTVERAERHSAV